MEMDNPGFQPDAEAAAAIAHALAASGGGGGGSSSGGGLSLPNNQRTPAADRRSLKNSRRQQQQHLHRPHLQLQRVFSVSCRALDVPAPPTASSATSGALALAAAAGATVHNNNAGEAKAVAAAKAVPKTTLTGWSRSGGRGLLGLGCRRRWELRPSPPPLLLALLVAAAATLALAAVAAVLAASSVLEGSTTPLHPPDAVPATTLVRGEFRLQPPTTPTSPPPRPHTSPAASSSDEDGGGEGDVVVDAATGLTTASVAALLSRVFRGFPRFAAAAASVELPPAPQSSATLALSLSAVEGVVRCELTFRAPAGAALAPRVGLHFLGALRPRAGRLWLLGRLPVDPRSVFFEEVTPPFAEAAPALDASEQTTTATAVILPSTDTFEVGVAEAPAGEMVTRREASAPGVAWGEWSAWDACSGASGTQRRTRSCLPATGSDEGAKPGPLPDSELCLLLPGGGGDLEVRDCKRHEPSASVEALLGGVTRMQRLREAPPTAPASSAAPVATRTPSPAAVPATLSLTQGPRRCDACLPGEVCVALAGETLPACRSPLDAADPTGCGGLCRLGRDLCHRLDRDAFRCIEDSPCLSEEWRCGNLLCIPLEKRCDGHLNCYDHTDEFDCGCDLLTHFHCGNGTSCLPQSKRCDRTIDCWDGSDELNCTQACPKADQFTCSDGQCIPQVQFCDGLADCNDLSDEPFGCGGACKRHEWRCTNGRCVKKAAVCDGADDCGDWSDEGICPLSRLRLRPYQQSIRNK